MRVLLIEDDSATAQSIELMLKSEGFNDPKSFLEDDRPEGSRCLRYSAGGHHNRKHSVLDRRAHRRIECQLASRRPLANASW
jgi:hypothetical protein